MKSIFVKLALVRDSVDDSETERLALLSRVSAYIYRGDYADYGKKDIFLSCVNSSDSLVGMKLGIAVEAVRKIRSRMSLQAYSVIGEETLDKIATGRKAELDEIRRDFDILEKNPVSVKAEMLFPGEFLSLIREFSLVDSAYSIADCKYELALLHWMSLKKIGELLDNVDVDRIQYLLKVINNETSGITAGDRANIFRVIFCEGDIAKYAKAEDKDKFKFPPKRPEAEG